MDFSRARWYILHNGKFLTWLFKYSIGGGGWVDVTDMMDRAAICSNFARMSSSEPNPNPCIMGMMLLLIGKMAMEGVGRGGRCGLGGMSWCRMIQR
jgi:hypothetical protein